MNLFHKNDCRKIIILIALFVLYSCNFRGKTDSAEGKFIKPVNYNVQINWIGQWAGEGDKEKFLLEFANEYEFINQDVKVNLKFRDKVYNSKDETAFILEQLKNPKPEWDILTRIHVNYNAIAAALNDPDWGEKYLVDFSKVPEFMESHKSFINTNMYKYRYGKVIFGPYNEGQLCDLYVNTEVAKKMAITVKQYGMTFDDFEGYLKAAYEYNKSHEYIAPIFEDAAWIQSEIIFKQLFLSLMDNYQEVIETNLTAKKLDALGKCYKACEQLSKYEPVIKNRMQMNWSRDNDFPLNDKCLFFPNYTFMYNIWKVKGKEKMFKMMPCELPVFKPSCAYLGGYVANFAVLKNSPHRDEAIKLMMYWCKPEIAEKWVRYTKSPSGVIGNLTTSSFGVDQFESFIYTIDKKYGTNTIQELDNQYFLGLKNFRIPYRVIEVLEGRMTAKAAIDELKRKLIR